MALFRRPQAEDAAVEVPGQSSTLGAGLSAPRHAQRGRTVADAAAGNGAHADGAATHVPTGSGAASGSIFADAEVSERERRREQRLVEAACRGEESAIEALYRTHFDTIYRYVLLRLGSSSASEDVTSQVFLGMVRGLGRYRDEGKPFVAWLYAMARKQIAFYQRGQSRAPSAVDLDAVEDLIAQTAGPHATAEEQELRVALAHALAKVPEGQREVILLRYILSMSVADTAAAVGRTEGAVKQLQLRGLATLKLLLGQQGLRLD
jgi:RNA polymerase sigma-70 factor, ECF subfamily